MRGFAPSSRIIMHSFEFLAQPAPSLPGVTILFGDQRLLLELALAHAREGVLGEEGDIPFARFTGNSLLWRDSRDEPQWRDIRDELCTPSLFGGGRPRLVVVEEGDQFVSKYRQELEDYVPAARSTGRLVLEVESLPSNTRLYKAVDDKGLLVDCRLPIKPRGKNVDEVAVAKWLIRRAKEAHHIRLQSEAAERLLELTDNNLSLTDQHLARLALHVAAEGTVTHALVGEVIGGWRGQSIWDLMGAAADGNANEALRHLTKLFDAGEKPIALFGQISWSLRRYHAAMRIVERGERAGQKITLPAALEQAGFRKWPADAIAAAERQIKQLGRPRVKEILRDLLAIDLALKGSHSKDDRGQYLLERLIIGMSQQADPRKSKAR